jgi:hypothetical protein
MEGLLERLARLSLKKAGKLAKYGGQAGGAALGTLAAPGVGTYLGSEAGKAVGGGVESALSALSERGRQPQHQMAGNLNSYQQQPSFGQRFAGNFGENLGNQAGEALENYLNPEEGSEEQTIEQQLEALLDSLSPEQREALLSKYTG